MFMLEIIFEQSVVEIPVSCRVTTKCPKYSFIALDALVTIIYLILLIKFGFQKPLLIFD